MSCLGPYYLPQPPREWSRVENACVYFNETNSNYVTIPLIGKTVPISSLYYVVALINKGNVLQYKGNSSQLNKQQVYSKIAKGQWTNRTTTWATQSDKYTNPNTNHLKRVGGEWIDENGQVVVKPSCQLPPAPINYVLPSTQPMPNINQILPPPPPVINPTTNNAIPLVPTVTEEPTAILDFGNLICNTTENICTGETFTQPANSNWHPTTDSDVPGPITELYWNERIQTWFPRQRLTMNNSTNKWPYNAKAIFPVNGFVKPTTIQQ
jgi:hypothetical protein